MINTISFDKAKIYKNKMLFSTYANNGICTKVFDNNGNNLINRITSKPIKEMCGDNVVISRKITYEYPDKSIAIKIIKRIYDIAGKLIKTETQTSKV